MNQSQFVSDFVYDKEYFEKFWNKMSQEQKDSWNSRIDKSIDEYFMKFIHDPNNLDNINDCCTVKK